nr:flagellar hook-length control protein FliK [uncultured Niameybacter sp.]
MINQMHLLKQAYQNNGMPHAALSDQAKAALLHCKQDFINQLKSGDLIEGTLVKLEGKLFLKELTTNLLLNTSLNDHELIGQLVQWEVQGTEGDKLLLSIKNQGLVENIENKTVVTQALEDLGLPVKEGMKEVVEGFTRFQLPLLKESIVKTFGLTQVTKLPMEVLLNILQHYEEEPKLDRQVAYKGISNYEVTKLMDSIDELFTIIGKTFVEQGMNKEEGLIKCFNTFEKVLPEDTLEQVIKELSSLTKEENESLENITLKKEELKDFIKLVLDNHVPLEEVLKKWLRASIRLPLENLKEAATQAGGLKSTNLFKEEEIIEKVIKTIKEHMPQSESLERVIGQVEEQLLVGQKLKEEGNYYTFPFMSELGEAKGKVYFYKPYKQKSKLDKSLYTVIALDMPTLKEVEIHIYQVQKALKIGFYVDKEEVRRLIEKEGHRLVAPLQTLGYYISDISYAKKAEGIKPITKEKDSEIMGIKSFDCQV